MRSPQEELKTIALPDGYHLELIASDPNVIAPSLLEWDGNGRMYVTEMRTYMLDIRGSKQHVPASIVSCWQDTQGTGRYDKHTVFADKLLLPRMILPLDDRILIRETDTKDIYSYRDTNGDGVSDEKIRVYEGGKQEGNLEHQPSGLVWNLDNWIYVTNQQERFRFTHGKMEKGDLPIRPGQWGIAMDDTGRMIYATAGSERPAHNFQVMPQYGDVKLPGELSEGFTKVFPLALLTDFEGGPKRVRPGGGLSVFTACCGPCVFRGDALPADMYGDYFVAEPAGRLIRRAKISTQRGKTIISNAYDAREFIASSDANFRPVWTATGPDGCLYICDMYRGIIQEANWTKEGSYLRPQIKKYGLDKNINGGRIWRLVHDNYKPRKMPHMLDETPRQLVAHLSDPNGWWRDTAQKLIILRGDRSVIPLLKDLSRSSTNPLARLHALWTLDGMDAVDNFLLADKLKDEDPRLRAAAVRIAEPLIRRGDPATLALIRAAGDDADPAVAEQVALSLFYTQPKGADAMIDAVIQANSHTSKENVIGEIIGGFREEIAKDRAEAERKKKMAQQDPQLAEAYEKGARNFAQTCIACHGGNGKGAPAPEHDGATLAPPLASSPRLLGDKLTVARIVLNGLTGPNNGKTYPGQMPSFRWADDEWLASILTFARNQWGNKASLVDPSDIAAIRSETAGRTKPFTLDELIALLPASQPSTAPAAPAPVTSPAPVPSPATTRPATTASR
jgi:mono/diheme cytochrome c family protein